MSYAREFDWTPISDSTPEFHFGRSGPVNMWIEFEKTDYSIWRGSFECGPAPCREVIEQTGDRYVIIAGGIGYIIDNDLQSLISKIDLDNIMFAAKINDSELLIANWMGFYIHDIQNNLSEFKNLNSLGHIETIKQDENEIIGKFDSSYFQWKTKYFKFIKSTKDLTIKNTAYNNVYN